jgi:hypothetical protein
MTEQELQLAGSWANVKLSDIQVEKSGFAPLPEGDVVLQLVPGAEYKSKTFDDGNTVTDLNVQASIAEGDNKGRRVFIRFPDSTSKNKEGKLKTWSKQSLKMLQIALGVDPFEGETPAEYLNRVATTEAARFGATLKKGRFIKTGNTEPEVEVGLFSFKAAA